MVVADGWSGGAPPAVLSRGRRGSARQVVHDVLRRRVLSLELPPGAPLSESELAAELGVSRTPVREALILLADEGLVEVVPQAGTRVSRLSVAAVRTAQFVREAVETAGLALAVSRAGAADHRALEELLERQDHARREGDVDAFMALDDAFHARLLEVAGMAGAWSVVDEAKTHLDRARRLSLPGDHRVEDLLAQHRLVARHLRDGRSEAAEATLRAHLRLVLEDLEGARVRHPGLFDDGPGASRPGRVRRTGGRRVPTTPARPTAHRPERGAP